jgi:hypothetical protein
MPSPRNPTAVFQGVLSCRLGDRKRALAGLVETGLHYKRHLGLSVSAIHTPMLR